MLTAMPLFAYGTLMRADVLEAVAGCRPASVPATLRGYRRRAVRGVSYPAIAPEAGGRVAGLVYRDVPAAAWARLDRYEGGLYARTLVSVTLIDGASLQAFAYVVRPEHADRLDPSDWIEDRVQSSNDDVRRSNGR